jgi:Kef-type K+ transport system membrane component KefB/nucleotide-binding universal stress UspA family protein
MIERRTKALADGGGFLRGASALPPPNANARLDVPVSDKDHSHTPMFMNRILALSILVIGLFPVHVAAVPFPATVQRILTAAGPISTLSSRDAVHSSGPTVGSGKNSSREDAVAGNGSSGTGMAEGILVAQVLLLLLLGRILGEGMRRIGQPALMGMLLSGILLGPSLFGWAWPSAQHFLFPDNEGQKGMIDGLSQVGILLLLLLTGMETDLKLVRRSGFAAGVIALCGIAFPFTCGFLLGEHGPGAMFGGGGHGGDLATSLFLGTALSISSIKIVAMVVREMDFMRRDLGQLIVATAIMEDTAGWVIIALIFGITGANGDAAAGHVDLLQLGETVGGVALFLLFCFTLGRRLVFFAIRWVNDHFRSDFPVITVILVIMGSFALITQLLGVRTVLGAFMAGVLIGGSPILTDHIQNQLRGMITAFFMPIFFGMSGLSADLTILKDGHIALLTGLLVAIASIGKFSGAFVGALLGRLKWREGVALGCAMNARGSTEVIVASIGLSMGALSQDLYTMIVAMAVVTTMAMPPMLRAALARLPLRKDEEERIEREAMDEKGFLPRLERLLLAADTSPVGRMAARLAGLLAGGQGMPVTILELEAGTDPTEKTEANMERQTEEDPAAHAADKEEKQAADQKDEPGKSGHAEQEGYTDSGHKEMTGAKSKVRKVKELDADPLANEVKAGAEKSAAKLIADDAEPDPDKVHLTVRLPIDAAAEVIKDEARKGYDLMFVALEDGVEQDGAFAPPVTQLSAGFAGPLIVFANKGNTVDQFTGHSRILLPVNGSPQSRRGAEVAFALARATGAHVHALFVSQAQGRSRTRLREEHVLKELAELGDRYKAAVTTKISPRATASEAILKESRRNYAMIVMGVSARPGEGLYFGTTATEVLRAWSRPILFLAS